MKKIIAQLGPSCRKNSRQRCDEILLGGCMRGWFQSVFHGAPIGGQIRRTPRSRRADRILEPQSLFFTKLDESRYFGPLLHAILTAALPVSYLSLGKNLAGDLEIARPEIFASLLLTGVDTYD